VFSGAYFTVNSLAPEPFGLLSCLLCSLTPKNGDGDEVAHDIQSCSGCSRYLDGGIFFPSG
jgi:hypothetical protein